MNPILKLKPSLVDLSAYAEGSILKVSAGRPVPMNITSDKLITKDHGTHNLVYNGNALLFSNRAGTSNWYDYKHPDGWIYADNGSDGKIGYDSVNECCKIVTSSDGTAMSLSQGLHEFLRWGNYLKGNQVSVRLNIKGSSNITCRLYDGVSTITETLTGAGAIENIDLQIDVSSSATGLWIDVITTGNSETIELYHCYGNVGPDTLPGLPCQIQEIGLWQGQGEDYPDNVFEGDTAEIPAGYTRLESYLNGRFGTGAGGRSKLPEYQGRFLRAWNNGADNEHTIEAAARVDHSGNVIGDVSGSLEEDQMQYFGVTYRGTYHTSSAGPHHFTVASQRACGPNFGNDYTGIDASFTSYSTYGALKRGYENRPKNINTLIGIRWC